MSSISSSFIRQINTKYEAWRLIHDPIRLFVLLYSKYGDIEEDLYISYANQLIFNLPTKLNCVFKEIKYTNFMRDYLKRTYKYKESIGRIPKLSDYYKNYHLFFCRPTLRHNKLGRIMANFQDKKAEIFYKNNYKDSKENFTNDKEENIIKKNSSLSITSFDNITNNKIIFDKYTKKMLDKSETELKNNNYYNTLILETSRSNILANNGLISKRTGDANSFEKCVHALMEYQYNKNKKYKIKSDKKVYLKSKKIKNIIINNSAKSSQIKKIISQSHRSTNKSYNFKIYNQYNKLLNKNVKINSTKNSHNNININLNMAINKAVMNHKKKKRSLYALTNSRYNTSSGALLGYKINKINNNINHNILNNIKENNMNYPVTTTHKESKKNRTHFFQSGNVSTTNNNNKLTNFNEYLIQSQKSNEKNLFNKKNCLSNIDSQNLYFNFINNKNNNRITKKKVTLNKNIKINTTNANYSSQNMRQSKHSKNKTYDYNTINNSNNSNNYIKTENIICTEEFNESIKKNQKKQTFIIRIDNNNIQKSNNYSKTNVKNKAKISSPTSNRFFNKISMTQTNSKEKVNKMRVKKILPINVSCNLNKVDKKQNHKKNTKSLCTSENINNTFSLAKPAMKLNKNNICLSPHQIGNNNFNIKNIGSNLSPTNQLFKNIIYFKTNVSHNKNNNNIYVKKSINKDSNFIKHKKNNTLMNSCNFNFNKEISPNISLSKYNNNNISNNNLINNTTNNINSESKKFSRNKKLNLKANFNYSKKSQIHSKINSTLNNNKVIDGINYNLIINNDSKNNLNNNGNINISIGKSNINIKDSILHIDKIYIKKENNKRKNSKHQKLFENEINFHPKKTLEMNLNNNLIKVEGKNVKKNNKDFIKTVDYSPRIKGLSNNLINVHRNFNLITNKNIREIKRKIN